MKNNQKGFGALEILVAIVLVGLIIAVGWLVYDRQKATPDTEQQASQNENQQTDEQEATTTYEPEIPTVWVKKTDSKTGIQFAAPAGWGDEVTLQEYAVGENIPVGFGAPVWVRFSQNTSTWQTIDNDETGNPGPVRADNLVDMSDVEAQDMYIAASYRTGDGGGSQVRVLVVRNDDVYQFSLPMTCEGTICEGDKTTTQDSIEASVPQFIKTIQLN